jgi:hypothetical protein
MNRWFSTSFTQVALVALGLAGSVARATDIPLTSVEELSRRADVVVRGTVLSLEAKQDDGGQPRTEIALSVTETWKGAPTNRLTVVQGSSVLGRRQVRVLGEPEFRLGQELVLFAVFNPRGEAVTLDLGRGKFTLKTNAVSKAVEAASDGARVSGGVALPGQAPTELGELHRRVREAIR